DYRPGSPFRFRMAQADYREALRALEAATSSFVVILGERLFFVVNESQQKRTEMEPAVTITVPVPEPVNPQELVALVGAVQQSLAIEKAGWDSQRNVVVFRDRISKIVPARQLFEDLLRPKAEVELEIEFLEVARSDLTGFGLSLPASFPAVSLTRILNNIPAIPSGIAGLGIFGGGQSLFGIGLANAELFASMTRSSGQTLLRSQIRSLDGQPATFHAGEKFPILTSGYFGPADFSDGQVYTPPPSFTFEDLGLTLKATPRVHGAEDVSLDLEAEFKVLGAEAVNGIPVISNRKLSSKVRLQQGQWALVSGLMALNEARSISGIAGVATLPLIGPLLRRNDTTRENREVILLLKPRLLRLPPDQAATRTLRIGSETRPLTPL
ncbi:MAG: type II and III secretion system protein, partial [Acidobacteria bacterium]|nr:type II and III secretion system protein [Acidobacteriota bacterium]